VFEVVSVLGIGGMGEVYLATDTRLKRQVAIKILPDPVSADPERLSRFRREAELLASLNHPHIAAVYGIEDTGSGMALIMELVEGADLRERLSRGTPPIDEALTIARQLARAISAAHERGIVHRDLKPGNIRLREDGMVKVLDFGLARAIEGDAQAVDRTRTATEPGTVMGTPRYMSPEQARGEVAGPQSDIWSFGVVLYELLTGRAAFDAPSSIEILARVLNDEPDFSKLPAALHPRVKLLLQRCLRKNLPHRLHHIGDAVLELDEATDVPAELPARQRGWRIPTAAATVVALIGIGGWSVWPRVENADARVIHAEVMAPGGPGFAPMGSRRVALSRDGQRIAIATSQVLYIRRLNEAQFVSVKGGPINPFFSPDGQWVGYFDAGEVGSGLKIVPVTGGQPKMLFQTAERTAGGDWREDGIIVFAIASGVYTVRSDGTGVRTLAKPDANAKERILAFPQFLRGSNAVLYTSTSFDTSAGAKLVMMDIETSSTTVVLHGGSAARHLPDGRLVYATAGRLKVVPFDPRRPAITPDSAADTDIEIPAARDNGAADFAISAAGDLVFMPVSNRVTISSRLTWIDRRGNREPITLPEQTWTYPRISPDGTRVAMDSNVDGNRDVWLYDLRRQAVSRLTAGPTEDNQPIWSHDGTRVYFASDRTGDFDIYSRAADGATDDRLEFAGPRIQFPNSMAPDGSGIFVLEDYLDTSFLRLPTPQRAEPVLHGPASERLAVLSPDGKWLAYESTEVGPPQVFVRPYPDVSASREQISTAGGRFPL
jgi:serine/threonine-protein kinase